MLQEAVEQALPAKIIAGAPEETRGGISREHSSFVEIDSGQIKHFDFLPDFMKRSVVQTFADERVGDGADLDRRAISPARRALEQMDLLRPPIVHTFEIASCSDWPVDGKCADAQHTL